MALSKEQAKAIYQQAFFKKLAEAGIEPDSEETAQGLLTLAKHSRKLAAAEQRRTAGRVKTANAFFDRIFNGDHVLDELVAHQKSARHGYGGKGKKKDDKKKKEMSY